MKIARKILLGYGLLSVLVIVTGAVGYYVNQRMGRDFDAAVNRTQPVVSTIEAMRFHAVRAHARAHEARIQWEPPSGEAPLLDILEELEAARRKHCDLVDLYFPHEADIAKEIERVVDRFRAEALSASDPAADGGMAAEAHAALDRALDELLALTAKAMAGEAAEFEEYQTGIDKAIAHNLWAIVTASIASFAGALLFGLAIARNISIPIAALRDTAAAYGRGEFDARAQTSTADEIGELARSFNKMAQKLGQTMVSREYVEKILESMSEAVVVVDAEGAMERANAAARMLLGEGGPADAQLGALLAAVGGAHEREGSVETTVTDRSGQAIPVELSSADLFKNAHRAGTVLVMRDIRERKRVEEQLRHMANYDHLTGLANRHMLTTMLQQATAHMPWRTTHLAVLFCDIDRFKFVNDSLGHEFGDELLRRVSDRLRALVRPGDVVARLGGDEFVILLNDIAQADDVARVAEKIMRGMTEPLQVGPHEFAVTMSMGICIAPADGTDGKELLKNADLAMYAAKREGRNRYCFYSAAMGQRSAQRLKLEAALREAVEDAQGFVVHYQAQQAIDGAFLGFEALVRWHHPALGFISPAHFLPTAEEAGLMDKIDTWVLRTACAQTAAWRAQGLAVPCVAVNVSDQMFRRPNLVDLVSQVLADTGLPPEALELELTEEILMDNVEVALTKMYALRALGVTLAIDDFGTGYSSLGQLKLCPIQKIKIDRSFIADLSSDPNDAAIVDAIIAMAKKLGMRSIAEGVETQDQCNALKRSGIDALQGYLLSRPIAGADVPAFLKRYGETGAQAGDAQAQPDITPAF